MHVNRMAHIFISVHIAIFALTPSSAHTHKGTCCDEDANATTQSAERPM
jgi:hypothetical protein